VELKIKIDGKKLSNGSADPLYRWLTWVRGGGSIKIGQLFVPNKYNINIKQ
jgi:hypothetical protein